MFQKPGGLLSFFFPFSPFFLPPLQTDVPTSGTCPALPAFCRKRKARNVFWHKFYGQPAVVIGVNFYYGEKNKKPNKDPRGRPILKLPQPNGFLTQCRVEARVPAETDKLHGLEHIVLPGHTANLTDFAFRARSSLLTIAATNPTTAH